MTNDRRRLSRARSAVGRGLMLAALSLVLAGCAALDSRPPEEIVKERAAKRWQALVSGDFNTAYDYAAPAYRKLKTREFYVNKHRNAGVVKWIAASVASVKCEETRCKITTELTVQPLIPGIRGTLRSGIEETWVLEDGRWWIVESL